MFEGHRGDVVGVTIQEVETTTVVTTRTTRTGIILVGGVVTPTEDDLQRYGAGTPTTGQPCMPTLRQSGLVVPTDAELVRHGSLGLQHRGMPQVPSAPAGRVIGVTALDMTRVVQEDGAAPNGTDRRALLMSTGDAELLLSPGEKPNNG